MWYRPTPFHAVPGSCHCHFFCSAISPAKVANKNVTTKFSSSESREKLVFTMLSREIILTKVEF
jgi:hypothetical protein